MNAAALSPSPVVFRPMAPGDRAYILDSYLESFRRGRHVSEAPGALYYAAQRESMERALSRCQVNVACSREDEKHILGYVAYEHRAIGSIACSVVHYLYVKGSMCREGLGSVLLVGARAGRRLVHTHETKHPAVERIKSRFGSLYYPHLFG